MKRHPATCIAFLLAAATLSAHADPSPEHAAQCVAALEVEAEGLAQQLRNGKADIEPLLVQRVQQGFAFIGAVYKQGVQNDDATRMLKEAEKAQESLPPADLSARQAACRAEGGQLLANANFLERAFVTRAAQRRVDKLKQRAG